MKTNQKGFSVVEGLLIVLVIGLIGAAGWFVYDRQKGTTSENEQTDGQTSQQEEQETTPQEIKTTGTNGEWESGSFTLAKLAYSLPPGWQNISDSEVVNEPDNKYEEVKIKASDGFVIIMSVNDRPRGYTSEPNFEVLDFKNIDGGNQWVITDNTEGRVNRIYVGSGLSNIGEKIVPIPNVGSEGLNIEISGFYDNETFTFEEFGQKDSVKVAKQVFESLKFN